MFFSAPETLMDVAAILDLLHACETVAERQYLEHHAAVRGPYACSLMPLLDGHAEGSRKAQRLLAADIIALGGAPTYRLNQVTILCPFGDVQPLDTVPDGSESDLLLVRRVVAANLPIEEMMREMYQEALGLARHLDAGVMSTLEHTLATKNHRAHALRRLLP